MSGRYDGIGEWFDRRRRRLRCAVGRRFRSLPAHPCPAACLFCDCEGHHAGTDGDQFADRGLDNLLGLLDRHGLRITFNVVAELCLTHRSRVERIRDAGHEIACHGWRHESPRGLSGDQTGDMLRRALDAYASVGVRPTGFRSPRSAWTNRLIRHLDGLGFLWDAERDVAWRPYRIRGSLVRVAVKTDDWDLADGSGDAWGVIEKWRSVIDDVRMRSGVVAIGLHEWIVGRDHAFCEALDSLLAEITADESLHVTSIGDAVRAALTSSRAPE